MLDIDNPEAVHAAQALASIVDKRTIRYFAKASSKSLASLNLALGRKSIL